MEAIWRARTDSARLRFTEADVRFMTGMIGHHAQAVGCRNLAPTNGASASIRTLAARIINAQQDEIALMQRWLRDRAQPVPEVHITGHQVMVHGAAMPTRITRTCPACSPTRRWPSWRRRRAPHSTGSSSRT
jgi:hypothetical protein